jgi:hypothetical protein
MKSKEEIEQLAESYLQKNKYNFDNWKEIEHVKKTYIDTYTQCQENMADEIKKLNEIINKHCTCFGRYICDNCIEQD